MQLSPPPPTGPPPTDVATAVTAALTSRGPGPAVTVVSGDRRDEQGVASLAQWAAKGAHLLEAELLLRRGDRLVVDVAPGWPLAAVCLAAWWAGITVVLPAPGTAPGAEVAVVEEGHTPPTGTVDALWTGAGIDGGPLGPVDGEPWPVAVQAWPDAPPPPGAHRDAVALRVGDRTWTQAELLAEAAAVGEGRLGVEVADLDPVAAVLTIAARPVAVPHATVVLDGATREAVAGERVRSWR